MTEYICENCGRHNTIRPEICSNCRVNAGFRVVNTPKSLGEIGEESLATSVSKGFSTIKPEHWEPTVANVEHIATKLMLIVSEVSEALEELRKEDHDLVCFGGELADIVIRTAQLGAGLGIRLDPIIQDKLNYNRTRPHQHGGRLI